MKRELPLFLLIGSLALNIAGVGVLLWGAGSPATQEPTSTPVSKGSPPGLDKSARKPSAPLTHSSPPNSPLARRDERIAKLQAGGADERLLVPVTLAFDTLSNQSLLDSDGLLRPDIIASLGLRPEQVAGVEKELAPLQKAAHARETALVEKNRALLEELRDEGTEIRLAYPQPTENEAALRERLLSHLEPEAATLLAKLGGTPATRLVAPSKPPFTFPAGGLFRDEKDALRLTRFSLPGKGAGGAAVPSKGLVSGSVGGQSFLIWADRPGQPFRGDRFDHLSRLLAPLVYTQEELKK